MDDEFDLEAKAVADGFAQGRKHGAELGRRDAQALGVQKGLEVGARPSAGVERNFSAGRELGYMLGCIQALQTHTEQNPGFVDPKHLLIAENVKNLIETFPSNPQDQELQDSMSHLRSRFKVLTAGVKVLQDIEGKPARTLEF